MNNEITGQDILDELTKINPNNLNENTKKLFDTIIKVIDERDELKQKKENLIKYLENYLNKNLSPMLNDFDMGYMQGFNDILEKVKSGEYV